VHRICNVKYREPKVKYLQLFCLFYSICNVAKSSFLLTHNFYLLLTLLIIIIIYFDFTITYIAFFSNKVYWHLESVSLAKHYSLHRSFDDADSFAD